MRTDAAIVVRRMEGADAANPDAVGVIVASGNTDQVVKTPSGLRVWAGKAGDPFWIEPDVLTAVGTAFQDGTSKPRKVFPYAPAVAG